MDVENAVVVDEWTPPAFVGYGLERGWGVMGLQGVWGLSTTASVNHSQVCVGVSGGTFVSLMVDPSNKLYVYW